MKLFYTYKDVMRILNYSESKAYDIIKEINAKLKMQGLRTEKGRVLVSAFNEFYGIKKRASERSSSIKINPFY